MSRLPRRLARRIDRLSRRAHAFHRAAHHPLCSAYQADTLRLGRRTRLCRGCSFAIGGALAGLLLGLALPPPPATLALASGFFATGSLAALGVRLRGRGWPKFWTRFSPACLGGATFALGLRQGQPLGLFCALGAVAFALLAVRAYRRRGPDRSACALCPDRADRRGCPGVLPLIRREAAFRRMAGRWIREARS